MTPTTKKTSRFRPRVERLESMLLLSQMPASPAHVLHAEAKAAPAVPVDVSLSGALHGSGKLSGSTASASGSGNLGKVGTATFSIKTSINHLPSKVTISTKKGNITLAADGVVTQYPSYDAIDPGGYSLPYTVVGGTKAYAKAFGNGTATATYTLLKGNKVSLTITFS